MRTKPFDRRPRPPGGTRALAMALLPAALAAPTAAAFAQEDLSERVVHAVEVEDEATVTVMNFAGHVEVHETDPGEERILRIVGVKRLTEERSPEEAARLFDRVDLDLTSHGAHYRIGPAPTHAREAARGPSRRGRGGRSERPERQDPTEEVPITEIRVPRRIPPVSVDLEVWLPDGASLVVRTFSAAITVAGLSSPEATFRLRSISGEVTVRDLAADAFHAETVSGSLSIRGLAARRTHLQTLSGAVRLAGAFRPRGWYDIQTHSGEVAVELPAGDALAIEATTYSGDIESGIEMEGPADPREIRVHRGRGGPHFAVNTFSGAVRLTAADAESRER